MKTKDDVRFMTTHQTSEVHYPFVVINPTPNLQLKERKARVKRKMDNIRTGKASVLF